jgi:hypothetical protein
MSPSAPRVALLLCLSLALALGCRPRSGGKAPGKSEANVSAECANGATFVDGPYTYENNQWGSGKARGKFEQCLLKRQAGDRVEYGWTWDFPGVDTSVFAYPEIIFGWKPWSGGTPSDARFPLRVADVQKLSLVYEVATEATGHYNLAPEVWLTREKPSGFAPNPSLISTEIMFWVESAGQARPAGGIVDHTVVDGKRYDLWRMDGAGDKGNGQGWRLLSFTLRETERKGTIPIDDLLEYLAGAGQIDAREYVASVEFGNEISGGRGTTWVKRFQVEVAP